MTWGELANQLKQACKKTATVPTKHFGWMVRVEQSTLKNFTNDSIFMMNNSDLFPVMKNISIITLPALRKLYNYVELKIQVAERYYRKSVSCN